jgi:hypothetical protein
MCVTSRQSQRRESQPERRVQFNADELSADILALLASCGQAVRKTDLPKVHSLLGSLPAGAQARTRTRRTTLERRGGAGNVIGEKQAAQTEAGSGASADDEGKLWNGEYGLSHGL